MRRLLLAAQLLLLPARLLCVLATHLVLPHLLPLPTQLFLLATHLLLLLALHLLLLAADLLLLLTLHLLLLPAHLLLLLALLLEHIAHRCSLDERRSFGVFGRTVARDAPHDQRPAPNCLTLHAGMTAIQLTCPGTAANAVRLTNEFTTPAGIGHPTNTGECTLFLVAFDGDDKVVNELQLDPGQSVDWYTPPAGAVAIFAACHEECPGTGELRIDTPNV
jgi:hypothetical protein